MVSGKTNEKWTGDAFADCVPKHMPKLAHPATYKLFEEMSRRGVTYRDIANHTGVTPGTVARWRYGDAKMSNVDRALSYFGYSLQAVKED